MNQVPRIEDNPDGLHQRYTVTKNNGELVDRFATYFVLRLDNQGRDMEHIRACRAAARAYADYVQRTSPRLAKVGAELLRLVESFEAARPVEKKP